MLTKILKAFSLLWMIILVSGAVHAHPPNTTSSSIKISENNPHNADVVITINWVQFYALQDEVPVQQQDEFLSSNFDALQNYVVDKFKVTLSDSEQCKLNIDKENSLLVSSGHATDIILLGKLNCEASISTGTLTIDLFNEIEATQNYFSVYSELPGQEVAYDSGILDEITTSYQFDISKGVPLETQANKSSGDFANNLMQIFENRVNELTIGSFLIIFFIAMAVGSLHALEGGHGKLILGSIMVENKATLKQGFMFSTLFTLTHMSDLIIVGILLLILDSFRDIFSLATRIQEFAIYAMILIATWQLFKELSHVIKVRTKALQHHHDHEHDHHHNHKHDHDGHDHPHHHHNIEGPNTFKEKMALAFLEGLAPCLMGWTIMLMVVSTGTVWLMFPILFAFALGIFLVLVTIMLLVYRFKISINRKISWFSMYSGLISAILLMLTTIYLAVIYL